MVSRILQDLWFQQGSSALSAFAQSPCGAPTSYLTESETFTSVEMICNSSASMVRSIHPEMFFVKCVLKICGKSQLQENHTSTWVFVPL